MLRKICQSAAPKQYGRLARFRMRSVADAGRLSMFERIMRTNETKIQHCLEDVQSEKPLEDVDLGAVKLAVDMAARTGMELNMAHDQLKSTRNILETRSRTHEKYLGQRRTQLKALLMRYSGQDGGTGGVYAVRQLVQVYQSRHRFQDFEVPDGFDIDSDLRHRWLCHLAEDATAKELKQQLAQKNIPVKSVPAIVADLFDDKYSASGDFSTDECGNLRITIKASLPHELLCFMQILVGMVVPGATVISSSDMPSHA